MNEILQFLLNALPEALGGLIAAGIVALVTVTYRRLSKRKPDVPTGSTDIKQPEPLDATRMADKASEPHVEHNLPARGHFVDREREVKAVLNALAKGQHIVAIEGLDGFGKTAVALEVAYTLAQQSGTGQIAIDSSLNFDAVIWVSSEYQVVDSNMVIDVIARVMGYPYIAALPPADAHYEIHKTLRTHRILLVIDDFAKTNRDDLWRFLQELPEPTKVIITTQRMLLENVTVVSLNGLGENASLELLINEARRIDARPIIDAEMNDLGEICNLTSGSPLLLKWIAGYVKRTGQTLPNLTSKLRRAQGDAVHRVWGRLWGLLSENAQLILMIMPFFAKDVTRECLSAITQLSDDQLETVITELVDIYLLKVNTDLTTVSPRYAVHSITRSFGQARLAENREVETQARVLWKDYMVAYAFSNYSKGRTAASYQALEAERENLLACATWCYQEQKRRDEGNLRRAVVGLSTAMGDYLWARAYWDERLQLSEWAIQAARELQDWRSVAYQSYSACWVTYWRRSDHASVEYYLSECEEAGKQIEAPEPRGWLLHMQAIIATGKRQFEIAKPLLLEALELVSDEVGFASKASIMLDLGHLERFQGDLNKAKHWFERTVTVNRASGDTEGTAIALSYLAEVERSLEELDTAKMTFEQALNNAEEIMRPTTIARCKKALAEIAYVRSERDLAISLMNEAILLYERLGMLKKASECRIKIQKFGGR